MKNKSKLYAENADAMEACAKDILSATKERRVITLTGDLGSGKTTLSKHLTNQLTGISIENITSPTFSQVITYEGEKLLHHFDLYRITSIEEFLMQGFSDYIDEKEATLLIEWPEVAAPLLPRKRVDLQLKHAKCGGRIIEMEIQQ